MGEFLETQDEKETLQLRSRELQLENTEKLNDILPIVEGINDVNLNQIESDTAEIKNIVIENLDNQPNIEEVVNSFDKLNKNISSLKGQVTKLSKTLTEIEKKLNEVDS